MFFAHVHDEMSTISLKVAMFAMRIDLTFNCGPIFLLSLKCNGLFAAVTVKLPSAAALFWLLLKRTDRLSLSLLLLLLLLWWL